MLFPTMQVECGFHAEKDGRELLVEIGPEIQVVISFDPAHFSKTFIHNPSHPLPSMNVQALVDTGAKNNHIDANVAKALNLPVVNRRTIAGSSGKHVVDVYLAHIHIPALEETIPGEFSGVKLVEAGSRHGAILGRTFLKNITLVYKGLTGQVSLRNHRS
ncbi:MAG: hypothetical protein WDO70_01910 [Alphaproteobacteria bacterium]